VKLKMLDQVNERTRDGRVFSAGADSVRTIDDADENMADLARSMTARGLAEVVADEPEPESEEDTDSDPDADDAKESADAPDEAEPEPAPIAHSHYEDRTIVELRELARGRGLPVSGSKDDLIARIRGGE